MSSCSPCAAATTFPTQDAEATQRKVPTNSCRSSLTSVMLTSNQTPVYVAPTLIPHDPTGLSGLDSHGASSGSTWAVKMERSSQARMMAERRLCLGLSATGDIAWVSNGTPDSLFGLITGELLGQPITGWVDIFADFASGGCGDKSSLHVHVVPANRQPPAQPPATGATWHMHGRFLPAQPAMSCTGGEQQQPAQKGRRN